MTGKLRGDTFEVWRGDKLLAERRPRFLAVESGGLVWAPKDDWKPQPARVYCFLDGEDISTRAIQADERRGFVECYVKRGAEFQLEIELETGHRLKVWQSELGRFPGAKSIGIVRERVDGRSVVLLTRGEYNRL